MQDEHFQRQWSSGHTQFSGGIDVGFERLRAVIIAIAPACGRALRKKARLTAGAVMIGFVSGLAIGAALVATSLSAAPRGPDMPHTEVRVYARHSTLA